MNGPFYQEPERPPRYLHFHDAHWTEHVIARTVRPYRMSRDSGDPLTYEKSMGTEVSYRLRVYYGQGAQEVFFEFRDKQTRDRVWDWLAPAEDVCQ